MDLNGCVLAGRLDYLSEIRTRLRFLNFLLTRYEESMFALPPSSINVRSPLYHPFSFLLFCSVSVFYPLVLPHAHYDTLWDCLVTRAITPSERDECFNWLIFARKEPQDAFVVRISIRHP